MTWAVSKAAALVLWVSLTWATPSYADATDVAKTDIEGLLEQIDTATRAGRLVQADAMLSWLEKSVEVTASGAVAMQRAEFHMAKSDVAAASAALDRAGSNSGNACRRSRLSGWIAGKSADWNRAILQLADAIDSCGEDATLWDLLGLALIGKGEYAASLEAFDSALILQPDHPGLLNNRALALFSAGKYEAAMADLRRAVDAAPSDVAIRNNADYLSGALGIQPVRRESDSDAVWAARLTRTGDGARDSDRGSNATAYFANAALLSDRFDARIWAQATPLQDWKED